MNPWMHAVQSSAEVLGAGLAAAGAIMQSAPVAPHSVPSKALSPVVCSTGMNSEWRADEP